MEMLGRVRRMHVRDKISVREIAKRTGLSRNTLRKWLRNAEQVEEPIYSRASGFGKLAAYTDELVLEWRGHFLQSVTSLQSISLQEGQRSDLGI